MPHTTGNKGFFELHRLTKIGCWDLLAGINYSFSRILFCYTLS